VSILKRYLLIDGYNIINAWPVLKELARTSLEDARDHLIQMLVDYKAYTDQDIWIVFDAHQVKSGDNRRDEVKGIHIVFTKENQTADSFIEMKASQLAKKRLNEVRVATSDWAEQQVVLGSGGIRVSARELLIEIEDNLKRIVKKTEDINRSKYLLSDRIDKKIAKKLEEWRKEKNNYKDKNNH